LFEVFPSTVLTLKKLAIKRRGNRFCHAMLPQRSMDIENIIKKWYDK
jgi:hypothetical protein